MNNQSFYMHPRYPEFLMFLESVKTDARINPNALNLAFDVWLSTKTDDIQKLKNDLDRLHRERDSFQQQARVLAEEVERLNSLFLVGIGYAVGERGDACLAIDGGNL